MVGARAAHVGSATEMPDAVVSVLHAMYDLWEVWRREAQLSRRTQNERADSGGGGGQTAAALISARGGTTHEPIDFAENLGFGRQPFGVTPFGGGWYWQEYVDEREEVRAGWYASHVRWKPVLVPLESAYAWLAAQPEIAHP